MAEEVAYKVSVDSANAGKSLKDLKREFKEIQQELRGLNADSKQYAETLKRLGETKDDIALLNDKINAFADDAGRIKAIGNVVQGLGGAFAAAQGAAALFGSENEDLQKTLVKLQAAMAFQQGLAGLKNLGDGFKVLGTIIKANPLFLIVSIIVAIGAALFALKDKIGIVGKAFDAIGDAIGWVIDKIKEFTDWIGLSSFAMDEFSEKTIANAKSMADAIQKRYDREIELAKAAGKNTIDVERKKQQAIIATAKLEAQLIVEAAKARGSWSDGEEERLTELIKMTDEAAFQIRLINQREEKENKDKNAKNLEDYKKLQEEKRKADEKERIDYLNHMKDLEEIRRLMLNSIAAEEEKLRLEKEAKDEEAFNKEIERQARGNAARLELYRLQSEQTLATQLEFLEYQKNAELANAELTASERALIEEKYENQVSELKQQNLTNYLQLSQQSVEATKALTDVLFDYQLNKAQGNAQKEREIKKKQFQVNKAFSVAQIVLNTVMGIMQAISGSPPPMSWVLAGINSAMGTAATIKALSQKFDGGGSSGGGGGGFSMPSVSAPSITPPSQGGTQLNSDGTVKIPESAMQPTVKAVVVETDVTKTQKKVGTMEVNSKF